MKLFGINIGAPSVPTSVFQQAAGNDPVLQQAAGQAASDVNGMIQAGNKSAAAGMGAIGTLGALGAAGVGPFASSGATGDLLGTGVPATDAATSGGSSSLIDGLIGAAKQGAGAVASFLQNHGSDLLQAAGIADAAYRETQANKYATDAYKQAQDAYNAKAPLRALGIAGMTNAGIGNPFATTMKNGQPAGPSSPALPIAGQGGDTAVNLPQPYVNYTTPPRTGPVAAPTTGPNVSTFNPMRIAGM